MGHRKLTTVGQLIGMLSEVEDKSLPVVCATDAEVNGFISPEWVAPQDRDPEDEPGPPRYVLIGTDSNNIYLEDVGEVHGEEGQP